MGHLCLFDVDRHGAHLGYDGDYVGEFIYVSSMVLRRLEPQTSAPRVTPAPPPKGRIILERNPFTLHHIRLRRMGARSARFGTARARHASRLALQAHSFGAQEPTGPASFVFLDPATGLICVQSGPGGE